MHLIKYIEVGLTALTTAYAWADTWIDVDTGYTWTYRVNGETAEIYNNYSAAISPKPTGALTIPSAFGGKRVTSIGPYAFSGCSGLTSVTIPNSVTNIGSYAFYNCSGLTSVVIPDSVTSIGYSAFGGCSGLTSVYITDIAKWLGISFGRFTSNPRYFSSSTNLYLNGLLLEGDLIIPDGVRNVGDYAFRGCSGLTSVTIPNSVTNIGSHAFYDCSGLTNAMIGAGVTSIGPYAFSGCRGLANVMIGAGVTSIGSYAFYNCSGLTSVVIPDSVANIGERAFYNCKGLTSVTIPNSVTNIGYSAFGGCSGLTSVYITDIAKWLEISFGDSTSNPRYVGSSTNLYLNGLLLEGDLIIPDGVRNVGDYAFRDCSGLTSVTIPNSVTNIGSYAFYNCSGLTNAMIGAGVTSIGSSAFYSCSGLTSVMIPDSVANIGDSAFRNCSGLTSVTIPNSVTNIGYSAFGGCSGLTSVYITDIAKWLGISFGSFTSNPRYFSSSTNLYLNGLLLEGDLIIPDGVRNVGDYAFRDCSGLTSVTIPNSVTNIGSYAFYNCSGLTSVVIPDKVTSIGVNAFYNCSGLTSVVIPDSVTSIGYSAFYGCSGLTSVTIPNSVTNIGPFAFCNCSGLTNATIGAGVTSIGAIAFGGCGGLTSVEIPASVTNIGRDAFQYCNKLTCIIMSGGITDVGLDVFREFDCVVFDANGGIGDLATMRKHNKALGELTVPTREGYAFDGWFSSLDGGTRVSPSTVVTTATTNYAHWVEIPFSFDGDAEWKYEGDGIWRSGAIDCGGYSSAALATSGPGQLSFKWRASSEYDVEENAAYDYGYLTVDGVVMGGVDEGNRLFGYAIGGEVDWTNVVMDIAGSGVHSIVWTYCKDEYDEIFCFEDCVWLCDVVWTPRMSLSFSLGGGEGAAPTPMQALEGAVVALPSTDGFGNPRHAFVGWSDGVQVYPAGANYAVTSDVAFVATWQAKTLVAPTISSAQVSDGGEVSDSAFVTLEISAEEGVSIHYTVDGSTPTLMSAVYDGPMTLTDYAATIKAVAFRDDYFDSEVTAFSFTRIPYTPKECLGLKDVEGVGVTCGGDGGSWHRVLGEEAHDGVVGLKSGVLTHSQTNWVEMTVQGPGTLMFWWKASSESIRGKPRDGATFFSDGQQIGGMIGGTTNGWSRMTHLIEEEGAHTFRWTYSKSAMDSADIGEDCAWLGNVIWMSPGAVAVEVEDSGKTIVMPSAWFEGCGEAVAMVGGDREVYAYSTAANGRKVWECYVVGLDPEDTTNDFRIVSFPMGADGTPDISAIAFDPPEAKWNVQGATPVLKGKATLEGTGEWQTVTDENKAEMRFFRVEVEMP